MYIYIYTLALAQMSVKQVLGQLGRGGGGGGDVSSHLLKHFKDLDMTSTLLRLSNSTMSQVLLDLQNTKRNII